MHRQCPLVYLFSINNSNSVVIPFLIQKLRIMDEPFFPIFFENISCLRISGKGLIKSKEKKGRLPLSPFLKRSANILICEYAREMCEVIPSLVIPLLMSIIFYTYYYAFAI